MIQIKGVEGLLFIGDPHLWSRGPGRRLDRDRFLEVSLHKLEQAIQIANERNAYPVILGDLFHVDNESNIRLLTQTIRVLSTSRHKVLTVLGNHEIKERKLSDDVATAVLKEAGVLDVIETTNKVVAHIHCNNGNRIFLGGTPYGYPIPAKVDAGKRKLSEQDYVVWLTHHDLDFGDSYPGVTPIPFVENVDVLVNGHIHKTQDPVVVNTMTAFNPGNILRLSTDTKDHTPSVWLWTPTSKVEHSFEQIPLRFESSVFDLVGKQIQPTVTVEPIENINTEELSSVFVEQMEKNAKNRDPKKTDDGVYVKESITSLGKALNVDAELLDEILKIADESILETKR